MNTDTRSNPYIGPRSFRTGETLYGRDREVEELLDLLIAERIVVLYAPSGAGKTSLVQAALIPRLEEEGFRVLPSMRVNLEPPAGLARDPRFNRYIYSLLLSLEEPLPDDLELPLDVIAMLDLPAYLDRLLKPNDGRDDSRSGSVLIFDQFEEILTVNPTDVEAKAAFFAQVGQALRDRGRWALFSMREDYVASLDRYLRPIPTRLGNTFRLDMLEEAAARAAMQQPARQLGLDFTDNAAKRLVNDLRKVRIQGAGGSTEETLGPYVEPVQLQVVCYRLWDKLPADARQIVEADVEAVGNVDSALSDYYAERVASAARETGVNERAMRDWCEQQLITGQGIRGQVLQGPDQGLDGRAIQRLLDAYLVRSEKRRGATWFELAHDRLIEPVRKNNAEWREANLSALQRQAELWDSQARSDGLLLRGQALIDAESWVESHTAEMTAVERDFLAACRKAQAAAERERRNNRLIRGLAVAALIGLVLAIVGIVFASQQAIRAEAAKATAEAARNQAIEQEAIAKAARQEAETSEARAEEQARIALARQLAAQAIAFADRQLDLAMLLGVAATQVQPGTIDARSSLSRGLQHSPLLKAFLHGHQRGVLSVAFSPDGRTLASAGDDDAVLLWDVTDPAAPRQLGASLEGTRTVFSPDGKTLASAAGDGTIMLWDVSDPASPGQLGAPLESGFASSVAFSPDSKTLASTADNGRILLWDVSDPASPAQLGAPLEMPGTFAWSIAFSPDGRTLASATTNGAILLWDVSDPTSPAQLGAPLEMPGLFVSSIAFSPEGNILAAAGGDGTILLWDISDPASPSQFGAPLEGNASGVTSVAFSPDGATLASAGRDSMILLWNVSDPAAPVQLGASLRGHGAIVTSVAFSPDGATLASASWDITIILWDVSNPTQTTSLGASVDGHTGSVASLAFSPDGQTLVSSGDGTILLWDTSDRAAPTQLGAPLTESGGVASRIALSPSGNLLVATGDGIILVWDVSDPASPTRLGTPPDAPVGFDSSIAFSPDGRTLAAASGSTILFWDVSDAASLTRLGEPNEVPDTFVSSIAFSPDGKILASAGYRTVLLWDVSDPASPKQLVALEGHTSDVMSVAFSPAGKVLASAGKDNTILLWDVTRLDSPAPLGTPLEGHNDWVLSLAFSPDGATLASGSYDSTIILWDVSNPVSPRQLGTPLEGHSDAVQSVAFSPDGQTLASGGDDSTGILWDIDPDSWIRRACAIAGRNLTRSEWQQYFGQEPYRKTCEQWPEGE